MAMQSLVHPVRTLEQLNRQRQEKLFTDVTIIVAGEKFSAHRALLAAHSPVFKSVLEDSSLSLEGIPNINLDGVESSYFAVLLEFLYTSKLDINLDNVDQVCATSAFLQVACVVDLCNRFKEMNASINGNQQVSSSDAGDSSGKRNLLTPSGKGVVEDPAQIKIEVTEEEYPPSLDEEERTMALLTQIPPKPKEVDSGGSRRGRKAAVRVSCPVCQKVMTQVRLEAHMRTHTGEKPVSCDICGNSFANVYNLKIHERKHTGEKPYKCSLCNREYSDPSSLSKHKLWHAGIKKKECQVCGRMFSTKSQVTEHMRTHTRERPFACQQCGKSFSYRCDLKRHVREHTGDLFGPCRFCGRYFNHRGNYNVHLKNHQKHLGQNKNKAKIESNMKLFLADSDPSEDDAVTLCAQPVADSEETILKVDELAHLVSQGHEIEVVINDGKLVVNQTLKQGNLTPTDVASDIVISPHEEATAAALALQQTMDHDLINLHNDIIPGDHKDS